MKSIKLFSIPYQPITKNDILEKYIKSYLHDGLFHHIVSLNPETIVLSRENKEFLTLLQKADLALPDGIGIVFALQFLHSVTQNRITGVDLLSDLLEMNKKDRFRILFIGGTKNLAKSLAECYSQAYPASTFVGVQGYANIHRQTDKETSAIESIVRSLTPHFVFVAFGSPAQELWIWKNRNLFSHSICMGVGGGFDFLSKRIARAPRWLRNIGLEWFFRLLQEPWRWRRQLRIITFIKMVLIEKINQLRKYN